MCRGQVRLGRALADYELSLDEHAVWHGSFRHGPVMSADRLERRAPMDEVREWLK